VSSVENLSRKLQRAIDPEIWAEWSGELLHWCPGCRQRHVFFVSKPSVRGHQWKWDGNVDKPTFSPSMNISWGEPVIDRCHYFIRGGMIQFLGDCTHALKNQTIELPDMPEDQYYG
jgi:uncharacterized protein DUF6527